jgi:hypothetical protein
VSVASDGPAPRLTDHALLVPLGHFAAQIGLLDALARVPVKMKTVAHSPGDKLAELLAHILAGGMHIQQLTASPRPLVADDTVAQAWGQQAFASASGVSEVLRAVTPSNVAVLKTELRQVIAPYRQRLLRELRPAWLVVDFDLTGLVVSDQATTYEGADFGYMGEVGRVAKGYQFARAQVAGPKEALLLGGFLHGGRTVSPHCLAELVALVEGELGRPRRRVEVVEQRLRDAEQDLARLDAAVDARAHAPAHRRRPSKRLETCRGRAQTEVERLRSYRDRLSADNAANPTPRRIILRVDGGFGDAEHLAWLYEQGYEFVARAHNHRVAASLRDEVGLRWEQISKNGGIAESTRTSLGTCPYPMRLFACRQWRGDGEPEHYSALVVTPELAASAWPARRVGVFYNGRQVAEASIKEGKGIFASRHLPTRHGAGIEVYQELVLLAQNLLRWFRRQVLGHTLLAAAGVKELVAIAANSRALVVGRRDTSLLSFTAGSRWAGISILLRPTMSYQLWFAFLDDGLGRAGP